MSLPDGYRRDEYFVAGVADRYRVLDGAAATLDGNWNAEPVQAASFKTRIVVFRPVDAAAFNGTVIVTWINVTAGYDIYDLAESVEAVRSGCAIVAVSAQRVSVHGTPTSDLGLRTWDPERYSSVHIDSDDYSYDIFGLVARCVGPDRLGDGVDPLDGLPVRHVIAHGHSQSANRLATYINALHHRTRAFDGYLLQGYMGFGAPLEVGDQVVDLAGSSRDSGPTLRATSRLRELDDAKIFVVHSELEAEVGYPVRQPDTDRYRCWEVAGTCHACAQILDQRAPKLARDFGTAAVGFLAQGRDDPAGYNAVPLAPVIDAALHHLLAWVGGGTAPPVQPRIEMSGEPTTTVRDTDGIAVGGARLPLVDVPTAVNSSRPLHEGLFATVLGSCVPFSADQVLARYRHRSVYLARFRAAAERAGDQGVLLPRDVDDQIRQAAERAFP